MTIHDVLVVVRAAGERTEDLVVRRARLDVPPENVVVVRERPFAAALERAFERGLERGFPWTLCLDADLLCPRGAIGLLKEKVSAASADAFGGTGYVLDRFYGSRNRGGPHLYRTSLLPEAMRLLPEAARSLRPETYLHDTMARRGHAWEDVPHVLALHDYEQYLHDVYRKMVVRARKSPRNVTRLLARAESRAGLPEFVVAYRALQAGAARTDVELDAGAWAEEGTAALDALRLRERRPLTEWEAARLGRLLDTLEGRLDDPHVIAFLAHAASVTDRRIDQWTLTGARARFAIQRVVRRLTPRRTRP